MQPSRLIFIPQAIANPRTRRSTLLLRVHQTRVSQTSQIRETRSVKPGIALRIYRAKIAVRRISSEYSSEYSSEESALENLLRHLVAETKSSAAYRKSPSIHLLHFISCISLIYP